MIKQAAKVIEIDDDSVVVEIARESTCSHCQVKKGCGTSLLENHVGRRFSQLKLDKQPGRFQGQHVDLAVSEQVVLGGAFIMYLVPLIMLLAFSAVARFVSFSQPVEIIAGFCGLFLGFYLVNIRLKNKKFGLEATFIEDKK